MLLFADSFDHYATADLGQKYTLVDTSSFDVSFTPYSDQAIVSGGRRVNALKLATLVRGGPGPSSGYVQCHPGVRGVAPVGTTIVAGFAFKSIYAFTRFGAGINDSTAGWSDIACLFAVIANSDVQVWFRLNQDGSISAYRSVAGGGGAGTLLGTTSFVLTLNVWQYLEFKVTIHDSAGTVNIMIDGVVALSLTGQDTKSSTSSVTDWSAFRLGPIGVAAGTNIIDTRYDDFYVLDASGGGTVRNDFLGDCRVDALYPTAEGNTINGIPSTGTNNAVLVDETAPNTTDYNTLNAAGDKDTLVTQNMPVNGSTIFGVHICASAKKVDAGNAALALVSRPVNIDFDTAAVAIASDYLYARGVFEQNPGTVADWTTGQIDASEFGYKKSTFSFAPSPPKGSVDLTGRAPSLALLVPASAGTLDIAGLEPTVSIV
jgi:hypothetical protein